MSCDNGTDQLVPPVGVEPTLGTLLGGRPLPLGYGGGPIIPRNPYLPAYYTYDKIFQFRPNFGDIHK